MHEQWDRLSRAVGNVFYPILEQVLPYVNGILMALTEIFNMVATLLGYKMPEFDYSGLSGVNDLALDIEEEMLGAGEATDKLANKLKGLRNFDKLNVINTPSASGSAGGVGGSGYVDPKIMEAFNKAFSEYDDKLDSVRMKASKIKDDIMKWLGFEKIINPLTGETEWKYQGIGKTIENIVKWFKDLSPLAKAIAGYFTIIFGNKILTSALNLVKALGSTGLFKVLTSLLTPFLNLIEYTRVYTSLSGNMFSGIKGGISSWKNHMSTLDAFKVAIVGVTVGIIGLNSAINDINKNGLDIGSFAKAEASIASMAISLGILGSKITALGEYGGALGAFAGAYIGLYMTISDGMKNLEKAYDSTRKAGEKYRQELGEISAYSKDTADAGFGVIQRNQELVKELKDLVDVNGKVKEGYEERVNFILGRLNSTMGTEYSLIEGVISINGDLVASYQEVADSIDEIIRKKQLEILLKAYEEDYATALKIRKQAQEELNEKQERFNVMYAEFMENPKKMAKEYGVSASKMAESLERQHQGIEDLQKTIDESNQKILDYEDLIKVSTTNNTDEINTMLEKYGVKTQKELENIETKTKETNENIKNNYETNFNEISQGASSLSKNIGDKFNNIDLSKLPKTLQKPFNDMFSNLKTTTSSEMVDFSKFITSKVSEIKPTMTFEINGNTRNLKNDINNVFAQLNNSPVFDSLFSNVANVFGRIPFLYANGGLPPVGQLFVANENGAELVGHIGGQSFVANQNQMMDLLDKKIGNAQNNQKQPQVFNFYLDADHKIGTYTLDQLQDLAKTNGQAITIG